MIVSQHDPWVVLRDLSKYALDGDIYLFEAGK
jgi:hypothetical protein